jgi:choline monooxygenase
MLPKIYYSDPRHLEVEVDAIFKSSWIFVGMEEELKDNNDFVCVEFLGVSIVVQNFSGSLRAFQNVCSHRYNPLQYERHGNRPLICRYHFWRFDKDGSPIGNSAKSAERGGSKSCLKKYHVEQCGKFIFVSMQPEPTDLKSFLGEYYGLLLELSKHIGREVSIENIQHAANWKLLVENVLECYHCASVHPETFIKGLGVGRRPLEQILYSQQHSSCHFPRTETENEGRRNLLLKHLNDRSFKHSSFYHIFIFPNLFISSTEGSSFYVGNALPLKADETDLISRFFEPAVELTDREIRKQQFINDQSTALGVKVIMEDRTVLERIQKVIQIAEVDGCLDRQEERIGHFFESYRSKFDSASAQSRD